MSPSRERWKARAALLAALIVAAATLALPASGGDVATMEPLSARAPLGGIVNPCNIMACATLTLILDGDGTGTVTSDDGWINCTRHAGATSGTCSHRYIGPDTGTFWGVVLLGSPAPGSGVWDSGILFPYPVDLTWSPLFESDHSVNAVFQLLRYPLTVSKSGLGSGTVTSAGTPPGINCGGDCGEQVTYGTNVTLTATADAGAVFETWTGACNGQGATCNLTITAATSTNAVFSLPSSGGGGGGSGGGSGGGETGGGGSGGSASSDTELEAELIGVALGWSALGKRLVKAEISADEQVSVLLRLVRNGKELARKRVATFEEGLRLVVLAVPKGVAAGKAKLEITLGDAAGNELELTRKVKIGKLKKPAA